jgi:hypothetical protein
MLFVVDELDGDDSSRRNLALKIENPIFCQNGTNITSFILNTTLTVITYYENPKGLLHRRGRI